MKFAFVLLWAALPAWAQVAAASLSGTVTDPASGVIAGATVTVRRDDTGFSRTVVTGPTGKYSFEVLAPGEYTINARSPGFVAHEVEGVVLEVNHRATLDIRLGLGGDNGSITVTVSPVNT